MKRFFSALLSLVLAIGLLGYLPVQVYAVDITNYVLTYPVTQGHNRLSRGYSTATGHYAIDISPKPDSSSNKDDVAVMAVYDGVVIKVFTGCRNWSGFGSVNCKDAGNCNPSGGYVEKSGDTYHFCNYGFGNGVIIYHPATKTYSAYAHMRDSITVNVGDNVVAGQLIGYMGSYGCSNGKHLHFEMVNTTASSPSINDYWKNYNKHNFVNTNPYGDITVTSTAQRNPDNIYYNFVDMPIVVENPNPGDTGNITTSWEVYSNEAKTGDTWIRPAVKCTMNVTTEKVSKVVMYIYNKDMSKQLLKVTENNLSLSGKYYYFTSYFYSNKKDTASNLTWEPSNAVTLCSGTTYKYKFVATVSGKDYESPVFEMSTTGTESHNWNSGSVTKQPTCTATGVKTYTCRTCGATKTESIAAKGHTPGAAATCTSPQKCTDCGTQLKAALGHNFSGSYYFSTHPHEEYQKCTRCNAEKKTGNTKKVDGCSICYPIVTFTITYNANGGADAPSPQTKESGKALTLSSTEPTRQGYTFLGWATSSGASSAQYNAGSSFTVDANTTLYAVWRKDATPTDAQLVVGSVTGRSGSIISVPISIKNNPGIYALRFEMDIDTNIFEFVSFDCSSSVFSIDSVSGFDSATKKFKLNRSGSDVENNVVSDGIVTVIKLKIRDNAADGTYNLTACVDAPNTISINGLVKVSDGTGSVNISNYLLGDANGDGQITNTDLLFMKRYIFNKMSYPLPCPMSVVDINGDNECTNADILRVSRYIFNKDKYPLG